MKNYISKEEINDLDLYKYDGDLVVVTTADEAARAAIKLKASKVLGFDTETRPNFSKKTNYKVCLLQLSDDECAYLFRLKMFEMPRLLVEVLEDPNIVKVGVAIRDDIIELKNEYHVNVQGGFELQTEAKEQKIENMGLRGLAGLILGIRISKGAKLTNWEDKKLSAAQKSYAAADALIGLRLYESMMLRRKDIIKETLSES
jgi:ribonuclease D